MARSRGTSASKATPASWTTSSTPPSLYEGFAVYHARFSRKRLPGDLGGSGYGYAVVYARRAGRWHRLGKIEEWIT